MKTTVNDRVMMLKTALKLTDLEFCNMIGFSTGTLQRIRKGEKISKKAIYLIQMKTNVNDKWLISGEGEMFNPQTEPKSVESVSPNNSSVSTWKDEAFEALKDQRDELKKQVHFLQTLISKQMGMEGANFNSAFNLVALLNDKKCVESVNKTFKMVA